MDRSQGIKRAVTFTIAVFAVTYLAAFAFYALGGRIYHRASFVLFAVLYMWLPALTAIALQKLAYREGVAGPLDVSFKINRWWLVGWLIPPVGALLAFGIALLLPGVSFSSDLSGLIERMRSSLPPGQFAQVQQQIRSLPPYMTWVVFFGGLIGGMIAGISINAVAAFGEELGWRGFLQKALGFMGFWKSSFVIGIIWGLWHAPLIIQGYNYPQHPGVGVLMMTVMTILLTPIFGYVRLRAKSVIPAAVVHGTFNGVAGVAILLVKGGSDLMVGVTGLAGAIALALINLGIYIYDRRNPIGSQTSENVASAL